MSRKLHFETLQLHAGQETTDATGARCVPIYQTAAYVFDNAAHAAARFDMSEPGNIYGRLTNPTQQVLETRMAALEGGTAALAVASGAAAVTYALENVLQPGDHIVAGDNLYGGSYNLIVNNLSHRGIEYTIVNLNDKEALQAAFRPNTKVVYGETFGNPNSDVTDLEAVADAAHRHNALFIVDNTFGTPRLIRPLEHGADVVVHSATKFIGGHGSSLGGILVEAGKFDFKANADRFPTLGKPDPNYHGAIFSDLAPEAPFVSRVRGVVLRDEGACISPFNAFLLLQGLETLSLRVERHVENALKVVDFLSKHPKVAHVSHPSLPDHPDHERYLRYFPNGGGSIFTFEVKGGKEAAWRLIDNLMIFSLLANVADAKSLVIHPASTTHSQMNPEELETAHISQATVRLSIGLEHIDDLIADLANALDAV
ncbi:MAG: O-acetylhomoserine aminocarboxypropyltransferase/cysteine synthase family protein [Muribaculaceae bacterium]|nr:O-acetylhomoserine aminocarboxypropyltransferase/cysteine synthase family protein [Muribaculaceae bacterium]